MRQLLLLVVILSGTISCSNAELENAIAEGEASQARVEELESHVEDLERQVEEFRDALQQANSNIEEAADGINDAQLNAFGDCDTLRMMVRMMQEPDKVSEP